MSPFINPETPIIVEGVMDNPTVSPTDKAFYVAGVIFTFLCLLLDIGMLTYIGFKTYRFCRRRCAKTTHGLGVVAGHEEKGLLGNGDEDEGAEQLPAYHDNLDGGSDKENLIPHFLHEKEFTPVLGTYCGTFADDPFEQSDLCPMTVHDMGDEPLDPVDWIWGSSSASYHNEKSTNKEEPKLANDEIIANKQVTSPTSKAAHLSPHENCLACGKLAQANTIASTDIDGTRESVTFPLTWDDMCEHGPLIKDFLDRHVAEDFLCVAGPKFTFHNIDDHASMRKNASPGSKFAHLSPHDDCGYCYALACPNKITNLSSDGIETSVTFPLTWDDMFEHKSLLLLHLPDGFKSMDMKSARSPGVHFD
ncbi:MAG: hypothetical protein Q9169_006624 [Polycauliona sp. 2 TL-2023]